VWASAALLGLNVLFKAIPLLFMAMKIAGALFLIWIAVQIFRHADEPIELNGGATEPGTSPFWRGFLVQIGNPKVVVFFGSIFVAMLPAEIPAWMLVALVALVAFNEVWWYCAVALFFGGGRARPLFEG
jgi:threonine/homoserine/homoserine lactone efflux protein